MIPETGFSHPTGKLPMVAQNLPLQSTPFVGRVEELAEIINLLDTPACRLLTLVGPGGIGKTRLALEAAALLSNRPDVLFPDGLFFVPLQPLTSPGFIVSALAEAVKFQFYPGDDPQQQLIDYLRPKTMLLVLDNFEHLLDGTANVSDLLAGAPHLKILTTSRETLNLQEEWLYEVHGMQFPEQEGDGDLDRYSAVQLFVQSARRVRSDFALHAEQKHVLRICQLVEGMPLALEMTAAWLKRLPSHELVQQLEHGLDILESPARNVPARHRSMRAVFDQSWSLLTEAERDVFKKLSVFRAGFRREAAEVVAGAAMAVLAALVDKSLLRVNNAGRYDLHELLRQYAAERLAESPEAQADTLDKHCAYYAAFVESLGARLHSAQQIEANIEFEQELQNIYLAWETATAQTHTPQLKQMAFELAYFLFMRNLSSDFEAMAQQAAEHISDSEPSLALGLSLMFQCICLRLSENRLALRALYERAIHNLRQFGADREAAILLYYLPLPVLVHNTAEKVRMREEGLVLARKAADIWLEGTILLKFFDAETPAGIERTDEAPLQEIMAIARRTGDRQLLGETFIRLGIVAYFRGDSAARRQYWQAALDRFRELGSPVDILRSMVGLVFAEEESGNRAEVQHLCEEALRLQRERGNRLTSILVLRAIGNIHRFQRNYTEAKRLLSEAVALRREMDDALMLANELTCLGYAVAGLGQYQEAESHFREALQLALPEQSADYILPAMTGLAYLMGKAGQTERAIEVLTFALDRFQNVIEMRMLIERYLAELKAELLPEMFAAAQERGKALQFEAALQTLANHFSIQVSAVQQQSLTVSTAIADPDQLTPREMEVLCLAATGLTNRQIAEHLVISPSTVNVHLNAVYGKLGVNSRTAATRYALDHRLC